MLPEAIILGPLIIKATLVVTILGLFGGALFLYLTSPLDQEKKKLHMNKLIDSVLYLMIFTIVAKITLNMSLFFEDPVAVLAYPSNSTALYLALVMTVVVMVMSKQKDVMLSWGFIDSLFRFLVSSQFIQLFLTLSLTAYTVSIYQLGFLFIILLALLLKSAARQNQLLGLWTLYGVGLFSLSFIDVMPFFGYYVQGLFYLIFSLLGSFLVAILRKKQESR